MGRKLRPLVLLVVGACFLPAVASGSTHASSKFPAFGHLTYYKTFTRASGVSIGDLNGDRKPDLAVSNSGGGCFGCQGAVSVLINKGGGKFEASRSSRTYAAQDIAVGDFNGDSRPDVAVVGEEKGALSAVLIYVNRGGGTLAEPVGYTVGDFNSVGQKLAAADLNGDGKADLVVPTLSLLGEPGTLTVLLNKGDGTFADQVRYPTGGKGDPTGIAVGDLNGDGKPDLAVGDDHTTFTGRGSISVLLNRGDGSFQPARLYAAGMRPYSVAIADANGDRKADVVSTSQLVQGKGPAISVLLNRGNGAFGAQRLYRATCFRGPGGGCGAFALAVADLNRDGRVDLAVSDGFPVTVLLNNGAGAFTNKRDYREPSGFVLESAGDLNGDGKPDLVGTEGGGVGVMLNATR